MTGSFPSGIAPTGSQFSQKPSLGPREQHIAKQHLGGMPRFPAQDSCGKRSSSSRIAAAYRPRHTMSRGEIVRVCGGLHVGRMVTPLARYRALLSQPTIARIDADGRAGAYAPERTNLIELTTA